jgi:hypothetical protein
MLVRVLVETDGNIRRVGMLDGMGNGSVRPKDTEQNPQGKQSTPIHIYHKGLVGAGKCEVLPHCFLGSDTLGLFVQGKRDGFYEG